MARVLLLVFGVFVMLVFTSGVAPWWLEVVLSFPLGFYIGAGAIAIAEALD